MTLDNDILQDEHSDLCIVEEDKSAPFTSTLQTPGSKLLHLQKQLRDELAKCSAAVSWLMIQPSWKMCRERYTASIHSCYQHLPSVRRGATHSQELNEGGGVRVSEKSKSHSTSKSADSSIQKTEAKEQHKMSNTTQTTKTKGRSPQCSNKGHHPKSKKADTNKKTTGTDMSHPIYHQYFPSIWLSIILLQVTVMLHLSTKNWKMHYIEYVSFHPSSIVHKTGSHINVSFAQEITDLPSSITTLAQSQRYLTHTCRYIK